MVQPARLQGGVAGPLVHGPPPRSRVAGRRPCTCSSGQQDGEQHAEHAHRRALLAAILSLGLAGQAQAKVAPPPVKKDAYQELQDIIKGRQGTTSLLDSFKLKKVQETVQRNVVTPLEKKVITPLQAEIKKAAPAPPKPASGGPSLEVIGGLAAAGLIGAATVANNKSGGSPAASKVTPPRLGAGTQRIVPQAKQAAKKAASVGTGLFGTQRIGAPQKAAKVVPAPQKVAKAVAAPVRKIASKASAAASRPSKGLFGGKTSAAPSKPSTGLFGGKSSAAAGPTGTTKMVRKPVAKAQQATKQAARKVQQQGGALKDVLTEDTGSTLGAAGILGLAVVVAGALVLGAPSKPPAKPAQPEATRELVPKPVKAMISSAKQAVAEAPKLAPQPPKLPEAPRNLVPKPAKEVLSTAKQAVAEAPKLAPQLPEAPRDLVPKPAKEVLSTAKQAVAEAPKLAPEPPKLPELPQLTPQPPSLPAPVTPPSPPTVIPEKPKIPSVPDLVPEAVKKPVTPSGPPPMFAKPSIPSGPELRPAVPGSSAAKEFATPKAPQQNPAATVAAAPAAASPATLAVSGLVVVGLVAAAVAGGNNQGGVDGASSSLTPAPPSATPAGGDTGADISERKKAAQEWIQQWRAKQK